MGKTGLFLLAGMFLIGLGCGREAPPPTKVPIPPAGTKAAVQAPAKELFRPAAEAKAAPPEEVRFSYNPQGKPNPFQPLVVERPEPPPPTEKKVEKAAKKEREEPSTPLERIELNALKLVAVVWNISLPRAMVEDAAGKGYILTVGTRIGKNEGQVSQISPAGVTVTEKYEASDGKMKTREVPLLLYAE